MRTVLQQVDKANWWQNNGRKQTSGLRGKREHQVLEGCFVLLRLNRKETRWVKSGQEKVYACSFRQWDISSYKKMPINSLTVGQMAEFRVHLCSQCGIDEDFTLLSNRDRGLVEEWNEPKYIKHLEVLQVGNACSSCLYVFVWIHVRVGT